MLGSWSFNDNKDSSGTTKRVSSVSGMLLKMKRGKILFNTQFNKRFCTIEGRFFRWYKSSSDNTQFSGSIDLKSITGIRQFNAVQAGGLQYCFTINGPTRQMILKANSQGEVDKWIRALLFQADLVRGGNGSGSIFGGNQKVSLRRTSVTLEDQLDHTIQKLTEIETLHVALTARESVSSAENPTTSTNKEKSHNRQADTVSMFFDQALDDSDSDSDSTSESSVKSSDDNTSEKESYTESISFRSDFNTKRDSINSIDPSLNNITPATSMTRSSTQVSDKYLHSDQNKRNENSYIPRVVTDDAMRELLCNQSSIITNKSIDTNSKSFQSKSPPPLKRHNRHCASRTYLFDDLTEVDMLLLPPPQSYETITSPARIYQDNETAESDYFVNNLNGSDGRGDRGYQRKKKPPKGPPPQEPVPKELSIFKLRSMSTNEV